LFQTEGYGSKTVQINPTEFIFINQSHTAKLNLLRPSRMKMLADCPVMNDAGYTNIIYVPDKHNAKGGFIYRIAKERSKLFMMRYDIREDEWEILKDIPM